MKKLVFFSVMFIFLCAFVFGEDYFWTGGIDNDWHNHENWEKGSSGTPATDGEYPGSAADDTAEINGVFSVVIGDELDYPLDALTINGTVSLDAGSDGFTAATINIGGEVELDGDLTATNVTVETAAKLTVNGDLTATDVTVEDDAELTVTGSLTATNVDIDAAAVLDGDITLFGGGGTLSINSSDEVNINNVSGTIGTLNVDGRDVSITTDAAGTPVTIGTITTGGTIALEVNGTRNLDGGSNDYNEVTIAGDITLAANLSAESLQINSGGTLNLNSNDITATTITNNGTLTLGTSTVTTTITNSGTLILGANTVTATTITNTGTLSLVGNASQLLTAGTHTSMGGTVEFTDTGTTFSGITDFSNLTIQSGARTGVGVISVSGDFELNGGSLNAASLAVTGTSAISGDITTSGDQTYNDSVTLGNSVTLTGTTVTMGAITGGNNNLTISGDVTLNGGSGIGALQVSGDADFNAALSAASVNVTGTSAISGDITTSGDQTYNDSVTLGNSVTLTGANVTMGAITGGNNNLTISGDVTLNGGTGIGALQVNGTADFNAVLSAASVSVTGDAEINADISTSANQSYMGALTLGGTGAEERKLKADGTITTSAIVTRTGAINAINIEAVGLLTIGSGGIDAGTNTTGVIKLKSGGSITVNGDITGYQLIVIANTASGDVELNNSIVNMASLVSNAEDSPNDFEAAPMYIRAYDFKPTGSTMITPGTSGELCLVLDSVHTYSSGAGSFDTVVTDQRYHIHGVTKPVTTRHLVYYGGTEPDSVFTPSIDYLFIPSSDLNDVFEVDPDKNIYIYYVNNNGTKDLSFAVKTGLGRTGFIEIIGAYQSSGTLTLNAGSGGIRLNDAAVNLSGAANNFDIGTQDLTLDGASNAITAANVSLGAVTMTVASAGHTLTGTTVTLGAITGNSISLSIFGNATLNGGNDIGALTINGNAVFSAAMTTSDGHISVTGASTINADITTSGTQTYTGTVTLGDNVTLTGSLVELGAITGGGNSLTITGAAEFNGAVNTGITTLSVSGTSTIGGDITTDGTQSYSAVILSGTGATRTLEGTTVTMGAINGGGNSLTINGSATLNGGSGIGDLEVNGTATINANISTSGDQSYGGAVTLGGTGARTLTAGGTFTTTGTVTRTATTGAVRITAAGLLTIGSGGITAGNSNSVALESTAGNIEINGAITASNLNIKTPKDTGTVTLSGSGSITTANVSISGECPEAASHPNVVIYIRANIFDADDYTGTITPGTALPYELCLDVDSFTPDPLTCIAADRYHHHLYVEPELLRILYSFTEDADGNGRLDRIRVQTNLELIETIGFDVTVEGYEVINFTLGSAPNNDSFYINLKEGPEFDGKNTPQWQIVSLGSLNLHGDSIDKTFTPIDTIPPRIVYTLTLPGHPQIYMRITEPVTSAGASFTLGGTDSVTAVSSIGDLEMLLDLSSSFAINDLFGLNITNGSLENGYFSIENLKDNSTEPALDPSGIEPKYPVDWGYTNYAKDTGSNVFKPPNSLINNITPLNTITAAAPPSVIRRVTDVLVSMTPSSEDSASYFAWPVWAKNEKGTISIFNGTVFLEEGDENIELQARINAPTLSGTLRLFYKTGERGNSFELWQPFPSLYYFAPDGGSMIAPTVSSPFFNFKFPAINTGSRVEFYLYSGSMYGSTPNTDQFIARLDIPNGAAIPSNWYTLICPFSFDIQNIRTQRGGVSVLNNVINSNNRENAYIRYELARGGRVTIQIYTLEGTLVKSIRRNEHRDAGTWTDTWDGTNNAGRSIARGMYFVRVVGPDIDEIRKIMVIK